MCALIADNKSMLDTPRYARIKELGNDIADKRLLIRAGFDMISHSADMLGSEYEPHPKTEAARDAVLDYLENPGNMLSARKVACKNTLTLSSEASLIQHDLWAATFYLRGMLYEYKTRDWDLGEYLSCVADRARNAIMSAGRGREAGIEECAWQISYLEALAQSLVQSRRLSLSGPRLRQSTLAA